MKLSFHLSYKTVWGETLHAVLYRANAGAGENKINIPLTTKDGENWNGQILLLLKQPADLAYHYEVRNGPRVLRREWQAVPRKLQVNPEVSAYFLRDEWRTLPQESFLYSSAVTDVFRRRKINYVPAKPFTRTLVLQAQTARPRNGQKLFVCGSPAAFGKWDPTKALALEESAYNEWTISLNADTLEYPAEYKFIVKEKDQILWESGPNRRLENPPTKATETWVAADLRPSFEDKKPLRAAGVVTPIFSLRSETSWGVGDFGDLEKLTDWAQATGQRVIQILPINDTTITRSWQDSYPYNAVSVYAFHPIYIDVNRLPAPDKKQVKRFENERKKLNDLPQMDYEASLRLKMEYLRQAYKQEGKRVLQTPEFQWFYQENEHWLPAYAMFSVLRDRFQTANYSKWPQCSFYTRKDRDAFCAPSSPEYEDVCFWYYVQYLLHTQLVGAVSRAREKGIILKGDIPIGISPYSVEAWTERALFNLNAQAGAPPDDFSATGQNWGFPTYNWDRMALDGYAWWVRRFTHMARYFDAYRIDHVLGFFRIWEIPSHSVQGLLGQFSPALPMDEQEIAGFGLQFRPEFLQPYISDQVLLEKFGDLAKEVKKHYLAPTGEGLYQLLPEYDTQRKVEAMLDGKNDEKSNLLREGLYALVSNVLFVVDRKDAGKYHPRISALTDAAFRALSQPEKEAFTRLYNEYFFRRHNQFWKDEAMKKLPVLTQATRMLTCAEDLGMIPACVPDVLNKLQMLALEIERMPKRLGETFADTTKYPYLSVATPSTHDMSVLRGWWKETPPLTQRFWKEVLGNVGEAPANMDTQTCEEVLQLHLQSPSMLALFSFQDWTGMDEKLRAPDPEAERINVPANPRHYWRYRIPLTLEKLMQETAFNEKIRTMIQDANR